MQHPLGEFVPDWSYESGATSRAREILGIELRTGMRGVVYLGDDGLRALDGVALDDVRELVANLIVYHLRITGRIDTVSQRTPA